eukprot:Skav218523  [mRNA]  locus=scaffold2478:215819:217028:- [translate_table: standard]
MDGFNDFQEGREDVVGPVMAEASYGNGGEHGCFCSTLIDGEQFSMDLMILRCIRPDRVVPAVLEFVAGKLGEKFVNPPPFDLAGSYSDSNAPWSQMVAPRGGAMWCTLDNPKGSLG